MPLLNWPNRITITRIALVAPFIICLLNLNTGWSGWRHLALVLFVLMAVSDALDGFLARRLNEETNFGKYLDPIADKLLIASTVILLAGETTAVADFKLPSWVAVIAVGKEIMTVLGFAVIYMVTHEFLVEPKISGKACTFAQLVMVSYVLLAPDLPELLQALVGPLYWLASGLAVVATVDYFRLGKRFAVTHQPE